MRRLLPIVLLLIPVATFAAPGGPESEERGPRDRFQERHMVLTPASVLTDQDRAELAAKGIRVQHALTRGRLLARVSAGSAAGDDPRIVSLSPVTAEQKLHPSAIHEAASGRPWADLNVVFHRDVNLADARQAVLAAGGALADPFEVRFLPSQRLEVRIAPSQVVALAGDDRVFAIAGPRRFRAVPHNATTAELSHVTELYSPPYGLTGRGVVVSLFELADSQVSHVEFGGRSTLVPGGCGTGSDLRQHATHVAGTIGASGLNADAKGMAPEVTIFQNCVSLPSKWLSDKEDEAARGVVVDNNSWGYLLGWSREGDGSWVWNGYDAYYGAYDLVSGAPLDRISNEKGILFVHSAGNDGDKAPSAEYLPHFHVDSRGETDRTKKYCVTENASGTDCPATCTGGCEAVSHHLQSPFDTMSVTGSAKNVLAVGAVNSAGNLADFSSRGPAKDGRVKPDVVARGVSVLSTLPTNGYGRSSGTSMAAPAVTGMAALLTEHWRRTFGTTPAPAHLRALIIAGTSDLGNPGPDYSFGFGLVDAHASADLLVSSAGTRLRDLSLAHGQQTEATVVVSQAGPFRVVLNWPDPDLPYLGGDDIADQALVNDLDVKVVDPLGQTHLPWVLNGNDYEATATRGVNGVDNTEMVDVPNAVPGAYRVIVSGTKVVEGPQAAVLVSSARFARPCVDVQEANDSSATARTILAPGALVSGGFCAQGDLDYFRFTATKKGPVSVEIEAGDTPVRATLTGSGVNETVDVPANSTRTLSESTTLSTVTLTLRLEAAGALGAEPQYSFVAEFGQVSTPKRRAVRR